MLLWFVKIYERILKKLQFTPANVSTLRSSVFIRDDLSAVTYFPLCSTWVVTSSINEMQVSICSSVYSWSYGTYKENLM